MVCIRTRYDHVRVFILLVSQKCVLCGHTGGAFKPTTVSGQWAHVLCALWIPEVAFLDATIMEPIDISKISKARQGLVCSNIRLCVSRELAKVDVGVRDMQNP